MKFALISSLLLTIQCARDVPDGVFVGQGIEGEVATEAELRTYAALPFDRKSVIDALRMLIYATNLEVQLGLLLFIVVKELKKTGRVCLLSWCEGKVYDEAFEKLVTSVREYFVHPVAAVVEKA